MKQRLRFLRRRHTDSSISSKPSVRPTPEQASKWAESFELLMGSRCKYTVIILFLEFELYYSQQQNTHIVIRQSINDLSCLLSYFFPSHFHLIPDGASLFKAFLSREYSQENVEFWIAVEEYKRARPSKYSSKAKKIYEDFIAVKSSKEVSLHIFFLYSYFFLPKIFLPSKFFSLKFSLLNFCLKVTNLSVNFLAKNFLSAQEFFCTDQLSFWLLSPT